MRKVSRLEREWATQVFINLISNSKARLERGMKLRQEMLEELRAGKTPTGYRAPWIRTNAKKLMKTLAEVAGEFNREHPHDQASVHDLMDILATALNMLKVAAQTPKDEEEEDTKAMA